jgi:hypothetical protein
MRPARWQHCLRLAFALTLLINGVPCSSATQAQDSLVQGPYAGTGSGPFTFDGDLRTLSAPLTNVQGDSMPAAAASFDGLTNGGDPPSTNGDVGPNHYLQAINTSFAIYSKAGALLAGPISFNAFFAAAPATGTACDSEYSTYPIVLYDPLADRWVLTVQATRHADLTDDATFYECIAISKTADPVNGGWYKYALQTGADLTPDLLNDSPKLAVWPDAYYMSANLYTALGKFDHVRVWALERAALLAGKPLREVHFDVLSYSLLPSNLRGAHPPAGSPNYFLSAEDYDSDRLRLWRFHADFDTPSDSWFGTSASTPQPTLINIASYTYPTFHAAQPGTAYTLDAHAGVLMPPVQYRNINGTESLWANHTVKSQTPGSNQLALRWYEIRNLSSTPWVYQQGTFDNGGDGVHRWTGSLAVDRFGNMAIGYSVSKPNPQGIYPGIRYAGRLATDATGLLPQSEITLTAGTDIHNRCDTVGCSVAYWGKYSAMSVDPTDDCTFWYTNEYGTSDSREGYRTHIGAFRYPACANLVVDRADDSDARGCSTAASDCSLRGAINLLNNGGFAGAKITFDPSITKVNLAGALPTLNINASHNAIQGNSGSPRIDGAAAAGNATAFTLDTTDFSLAGLSVVNLPSAAGYSVGVLSGTNILIFDNYLGTLPTGVSGCTPANASGGAITRNAQTGILVNAGVISRSYPGTAYLYNNVIGCHANGVTLAGADSVYIGQTPAGSASPNRIGLNASSAALPNQQAGIVITAGASNNTIGGNLIANNGTQGVLLSGNSLSNTLSANRIYNNSGDGICLEQDASFNLIGGAMEAQRNLIYSNGANGVRLAGAHDNVVIGNDIGTSNAGNAQSGVALLGGAHDNLIDANNHLSRNTQYGVLLDSSATRNNLIRLSTIDHNGLDGIAERNAATNNRWSMLSLHHNGGMSVDKAATSDSTNLETLPHPTITAVVKAPGALNLSGSAQPTSTVEVYAVSTNAHGFGEGYLYLGATDTTPSGDWSLTLPGITGRCFVAMETHRNSALPGDAYSTEFSLNPCRLYAPAFRKGS